MTAFHDFLHDTDCDDLPDDVIALARRWLLDLLGVGAAGSATRLSALIRDHAADHFAAGRTGARMLFDGRRVSPAGAALSGGMTIDAMDGHDGHRLTKGHVGCGILPALLAAGEGEGMTSDRSFLSALVVGYEIGTRLGIALHRTAPDYHTSGAWIAVAAAGVGARILGLDRARTREAIGIAEYHGPRSQMMRCIDHPTMLKDGSGWGAMAGVSAAYLARDGFTGAPAVTVESADVADLWADLGSRWRIGEQYWKPFPVCRWAQPAAQAVLDLRAAHGLVSGDVQRIEIVTFHESTRLATRAPATTEEAQYSTAYPVAVAMVRGGIDPADVSEESFSDPEIRRLAGSMAVTEDAAYNAAFPERRFARVALFLRDGRVLVSGPKEARGDADNPPSNDDILAKFRAYAMPVLGSDRTETLEDMTARMGGGIDLPSFFDLVAAPAGSAGRRAA